MIVSMQDIIVLPTTDNKSLWKYITLHKLCSGELGKQIHKHCIKLHDEAFI